MVPMVRINILPCVPSLHQRLTIALYCTGIRYHHKTLVCNTVLAYDMACQSEYYQSSGFVATTSTQIGQVIQSYFSRVCSSDMPGLALQLQRCQFHHPRSQLLGRSTPWRCETCSTHFSSLTVLGERQTGGWQARKKATKETQC